MLTSFDSFTLRPPLDATHTIAPVGEILGRGEVACLHAVSTNTPAIRLYENLGFTTRREMDFALLAPPS